MRGGIQRRSGFFPGGALITLLLICGVTHRQGYLDVAVVTVLSPVVATLTVVLLGTWLGSF